jgi:hypothetical protein
MEIAEQNQDEVLIPAPPSLPKVSIGYLIAIALFILEVVWVSVDPASEEIFLLFCLVFGGGLFFYFFCVYRIHTVIAYATFFSYPITPLKAVGFHFIPFYNLYWVLIWPNKIAEVVNHKLASEEMRYWVPGLFLLVGSIFLKIDLSIGLALLFGGLDYITRKIKPVISGYSHSVVPQ